MTTGRKLDGIDNYLAGFSPEVQVILQEIRSTIQTAVPDAMEKISCQIPAFTLGGKVFIFFAAFKNHIGLYPPVRGDGRLEKETARYGRGDGSHPASRLQGVA